MKADELCHIYDVSLFNIDDINVLLHEILKQTRDILSSDAGSIYLHENEHLTFNIFQNDSMSFENIYNESTSLKDLQLSLNDDEKYVAVQSFKYNKVIIVNDVYNSNDLEYLGIKEYDKKINYKTKSIITAPIIHPMTQKALGVIQLLNKKDENFNSIFFEEKDKQIFSMISSFIALAISNAQDNIQKLKKLNIELNKSNDKLKEKIKYEVKESEKKSLIIYHQSKLASMGEMIGNIAHQWRQPLSAISTMASGLSINIELGAYKEKETLSYLNNIVQTTTYLSQTIDDFRNFYKLDKIEKKFNLYNNIKQCLSIIEVTLTENEITVIENIEKDIFIYGYENELKQALLNIIQNAKDALIQKEIKTSRYIFIDAYVKGKHIYIKIKDNAFGINKDYINRVFEQSFTTKERVGGSGIGLFMTRQIIVDHMDGIISVENVNYSYNETTYEGAQFIISFKQENNRN